MRTGQKLVTVLSLATVGILLHPTPAWADNCSSLSDCFSTAAAAAAAAAGAGAAAAARGLPKVQRRKKPDPCLMMQIFLVAAIGLTIILFIYSVYLITKIPSMWAVIVVSEGLAAILLGLLLVVLVAITLGLAVSTIYTWYQYFYYRRLCRGTP